MKRGFAALINWTGKNVNSSFFLKMKSTSPGGLKRLGTSWNIKVGPLHLPDKFVALKSGQPWWDGWLWLSVPGLWWRGDWGPCGTQELPWEDRGAEQLLVLAACAEVSSGLWDHYHKISPVKLASPPQRAEAHLNLAKSQMILTFCIHLRQMPKAVGEHSSCFHNHGFLSWRESCTNFLYITF